MIKLLLPGLGIATFVVGVFSARDVETAPWNLLADTVDVSGISELNPRQTLDVSPEILDLTESATLGANPNGSGTASLGKVSELHLLAPLDRSCRKLSVAIVRAPGSAEGYLLKLLPVRTPACADDKQGWQLLAGENPSPVPVALGQEITLVLKLGEGSLRVFRDMHATELHTNSLAAAVNPFGGLPQPIPAAEVHLVSSDLRLWELTIDPPALVEKHRPALRANVSAAEYEHVLVNGAEVHLRWLWKWGQPAPLLTMLFSLLQVVFGFLNLKDTEKRPPCSISLWPFRRRSSRRAAAKGSKTGAAP